MSTPKSGAAADRLHALLEPAIAELGYDLEAVRVSQVARKRCVEVVVDGDSGVSMDAIADVARVVSDTLDGAEGSAVMGEQAYMLEVSSPGVHRPLTLPKHWRRAKTRLVKAVLTDGGTVTGRVLDSDEEGVLLEVPGKKKGTLAQRRLGFAEIAKARMEVDFSRRDDEPEEDAGDGSEYDTDDMDDLDDTDDLDDPEHDEPHAGDLGDGIEDEER
jgi:ribosome maturation factor RimP